MQNNIEKKAIILKALGHPVRLKIVAGLISGGNNCNVSKIVEKLKIPQSTISQHLKDLKNAQILDFEKQGVKTCYFVCDEQVKEIINIMKI